MGELGKRIFVDDGRGGVTLESPPLEMSNFEQGQKAPDPNQVLRDLKEGIGDQWLRPFYTRPEFGMDSEEMKQGVVGLRTWRENRIDLNLFARSKAALTVMENLRVSIEAERDQKGWRLGDVSMWGVQGLEIVIRGVLEANEIPAEAITEVRKGIQVCRQFYDAVLSEKPDRTLDTDADNEDYRFHTVGVTMQALARAIESSPGLTEEQQGELLAVVGDLHTFSSYSPTRAW